MGVPDTTTFSMTDVCDELQMSGYTVTPTPTLSLTNFFADAPSSSFDPAYGGGENCLLNYRKFCLVSGQTVTYGAFGLASDGVNIWATNLSNDRVSKIEPDGTVSTYVVGNGPMGIAYDGANMWVTNILDDSISKVTSGGSVTTYGPTGARPWGVAFDGTNMWTSNFDGNSVSKITPAGSITSYSVPSRNPSSIVFDGTDLWTSSHSVAHLGVSKITTGGTVTNYDNVSANICEPYQITFDGTYLWTANYNGAADAFYVTRITTSGDGKDIKVPTTPVRPIIFWNDYIWTHSSTAACLIRIGAV